VSKLIDGSGIIAANPHKDFAKITDCGYSIWFAVEQLTTVARTYTVSVRHQGADVATATFSEMEFNATISPQHIEVAVEHRRKGVATAVYLFVEIVADKILENLWDPDRSTDRQSSDLSQSLGARGMWAKKDRPFGKYPKWWKK